MHFTMCVNAEGMPTSHPSLIRMDTEGIGASSGDGEASSSSSHPHDTRPIPMHTYTPYYSHKQARIAGLVPLEEYSDDVCAQLKTLQDCLSSLFSPLLSSPLPCWCRLDTRTSTTALVVPHVIAGPASRAYTVWERCMAAGVSCEIEGLPSLLPSPLLWGTHIPTLDTHVGDTKCLVVSGPPPIDASSHCNDALSSAVSSSLLLSSLLLSSGAHVQPGTPDIADFLTRSLDTSGLPSFIADQIIQFCTPRPSPTPLLFHHLTPDALRSILPFETRKRLFDVLAFGVQQAIGKLSPSPRDPRIPRVSGGVGVSVRHQRAKFVVSRDHLWESLTLMFESSTSSNSTPGPEDVGVVPTDIGEVQVQFSHESGHGLGPTMEFFSLACAEFAQLRLAYMLPHNAMVTRDRVLTEGDVPSIAAPSLPFWYAPAHATLLHPYPIIPGSSNGAVSSPLLCRHVSNVFRRLGRLTALAMRDNRLLDLPFSKPFIRMLLGGQGHNHVDVNDLCDVDPMLYRSLRPVLELCKQRDALIYQLQAAPKGSTQAVAAADGLLTLATAMEDLCLDAVYPWDREHMLIPIGGAAIHATTTSITASVKTRSSGSIKTCTSTSSGSGSDGSALQSIRDAIPTSLDASQTTWCSLQSMLETLTTDTTSVHLLNARGFVQCICERLLRDGIQFHVDAFLCGFAYFAPSGWQAIKLFHADELSEVLCGCAGVSDASCWRASEIQRHIRTSHGYTNTSTQILQLLDVIQSFDVPNRRLFLRFITGSPRLPLGGFARLSTPLTVVKRATLAFERPDDILPTCSTCNVYLKLPEYSSRAILEAKLLLAMAEGQGEFAFD
jgi:hypothetical protein